MKTRDKCISLIDELRKIVDANPRTYVKMLKSRGFKCRYEDRSYLWQFVLDSTAILNDPTFEYSDKTRIFWTLRQICGWSDSRVRCQICGKPITHWNISKLSDGYKRTCSSACERKRASATYVDTCRSKYGVDNVFSSEAVLEKLKCKKDEIQHSREQTMLKKYGLKHYNNSQKANTTKRAKHHLQKIPRNDESRSDALDLYSQFGEQSFNEFKTYSFPFTPVSDNALMYEMSRLTTEQTKDQTPSKTIRSFHKSMYSARRRNMMSPVDYWEHFKKDENLTNGNWKDFFINRYMYANTKDAETFRQTGIMTPKMVLGGLTVTHRADTVSYLKPMLAKRLVSTYLADAAEVFCPL